MFSGDIEMKNWPEIGYNTLPLLKVLPRKLWLTES